MGLHETVIGIYHAYRFGWSNRNLIKALKACHFFDDVNFAGQVLAKSGDLEGKRVRLVLYDFKGEGIFFIQEDFDKGFIFDYADTCLKSLQSEVSLVGWVELDMEENYLADLYLLK